MVRQQPASLPSSEKSGKATGARSLWPDPKHLVRRERSIREDVGTNKGASVEPLGTRRAHLAHWTGDRNRNPLTRLGPRADGYSPPELRAESDRKRAGCRVRWRHDPLLHEAGRYGHLQGDDLGAVPERDSTARGRGQGSVRRSRVGLYRASALVRVL